ncbi:hypothetical protein [Actinomadura soli]|uniref:hypothetical protein n=1 Tax=Actinomadura soli TaxID=2508997 RepID=UPI0014864927|nr:hypothetical protein [Actinomadura soli]
MDDFLGGAVRQSGAAYRLVLYRSDHADQVRTPARQHGGLSLIHISEPTRP